MISAAIRALLGKTSWDSYKAGLGAEMNRVPNCAKGTYDFTKVGGAVGDFNLVDDDGAAVKLPAGAIALAVFVYAEVAVTSGGAATIDLNLEAANDLLAAEAKASFSLAAKVQGIPDFGTLADSVRATVERNLTLSVNTAALTAGKLQVYVFYVF